MVPIKRLPDHPNILIAGTRDVYFSQGDYRKDLRDLLDSLDEHTTPVRSGTRDFWITYPAPAFPAHTPNYGWEDPNVGPRPLRGIIEMTEAPPKDYIALRDELNTLLQEVGHYWLVPSNLQVRIGGQTVTAYNRRTLVSHINNAQHWTRPALLGRDDSHWSVYLQADDSPFDGQSFDVSGVVDHRAAWKWIAEKHASVDIPAPRGIGPIQMRSAYNDLDLMMMGVIPPEAAYAHANPPGRVLWLEPEIAEPLDYHVGVFVAFGHNDLYTFGFYRDQGTLALSGKDKHQQLNLDFTYRPFTGNGVVLRVVRRGDMYYFQARYDHTYSDPAHDTVHAMYDELHTLPDPNPLAGWDHFKTVAKIPHPGNPQAIGLIVRKWEHPFLVEGSFYNLELEDATGRQGWRFEQTPALAADNVDYSRLPTGQIFLHRPGHGALVRTQDHRLYLTAPFSSPAKLGTTKDGFVHYPNFDTNSNEDRAPKIIVHPASGDFTFGTSARLARTILTPWAGGYAESRTMYGRAHSIRAEDIVIPDDVRPKQDPPPDNTYKFAFILVAADPEKVPRFVVEQLDVLRHYWDQAFAAATRGRRLSNSRLPR